MVDFDLLEKAKRARDQAAAAAAKAADLAGQAGAKASDAATRAADLAGQASAKASDLKDSVASTAQDMKDTLATAASDLREASTAKIREVLADFNTAIPVLREMGYTLTDVSITLGMPPSLQATFQVAHEVTEEAVSRALEQNVDRKLITFLIRSLSQARKLQMSIQVAGMKPRGIVVDIGLTPGVSIKFS
jgi:ABC-type transporter Mla subunit MlaD